MCVAQTSPVHRSLPVRSRVCYSFPYHPAVMANRFAALGGDSDSDDDKPVIVAGAGKKAAGPAAVKPAGAKPNNKAAVKPGTFFFHYIRVCKRLFLCVRTRVLCSWVYNMRTRNHVARRCKQFQRQYNTIHVAMRGVGAGGSVACAWTPTVGMRVVCLRVRIAIARWWHAGAEVACV